MTIFLFSNFLLSTISIFAQTDGDYEGLGYAGLYPLYYALLIAPPVILILWLVINSFSRKELNSDRFVYFRLFAPPIMILSIGTLLALLNIDGQNSASKPIAIDSFLLILPFVFGTLAVFKLISRNTRKVLLIFALISALIFVIYHYPQIFFGK